MTWTISIILSSGQENEAHHRRLRLASCATDVQSVIASHTALAARMTDPGNCPGIINGTRRAGTRRQWSGSRWRVLRFIETSARVGPPYES